MAPVRQGSFLGGELAPQMWGRTDSAAYAQGLRRLKNAFVTRQGSIAKRPGTEFCVDLPSLGATTVRLIPFVYSEDVSFVLVLSDGAIRVMKDGALVQAPGGGALVIPSPYVGSWLNRLKFAQSGDVILFTHPVTSPYALTRHADDDWRLTEVKFGSMGTTSLLLPGITSHLAPDVDNPARPRGSRLAHVFATPDRERLVALQPVQLSRQERFPEWRQSAPWSGSTAYATGDFAWTWAGPGFPLKLFRATAPNTNQSPLNVGTPWSEWTDTGQMPDAVPCSRDKPVEIIWGAPGDASYAVPSGLYAWVETRIYRGIGEMFGLVGVYSGGTDRWWTDYGDEPDYGQPPPTGDDPWKVRDVTDPSVVLRIEHPAVVGYHQDRRAYARTDERPEGVWFSRVGDYGNFDQPLPLLSDSAIDIRLASRRREEIRSMLALERLLLFSNGSVWGLDGGGIEGALDATTIPQARIISEVGASWVDPIIVDGAVLYARAGNDGVQRLLYTNERGGYAGGDVSHLAQHLLRGHSVKAMDYARVPHGLVWVARDDGALLSLSYVPEADVAAWAQHDVGGQVRSLCVVPEDGADTLYLVVSRRDGENPIEKLYVERLRHGAGDDSASRYLDCHTVHGPSTGTTSYGVGTLQEAFVAQAVQDGVPTARMDIPIGGVVTLTRAPDETVQETVVGLPYDVEIDLLDLSSLRMKRVVSVGFEVRASRGLWLGEDAEHLVEWRQRQVGDAYGPTSPFTGLAQVRIGSGWNLGGRAVLRHREPLHLEVLGITREVEGGG